VFPTPFWLAGRRSLAKSLEDSVLDPAGGIRPDKATEIADRICQCSAAGGGGRPVQLSDSTESSSQKHDRRNNARPCGAGGPFDHGRRNHIADGPRLEIDRR
jgi:hypothetical protein